MPNRRARCAPGLVCAEAVVASRSGIERARFCFASAELGLRRQALLNVTQDARAIESTLIHGATRSRLSIPAACAEDAPVQAGRLPVRPAVRAEAAPRKQARTAGLLPAPLCEQRPSGQVQGKVRAFSRAKPQGARLECQGISILIMGRSISVRQSTVLGDPLRLSLYALNHRPR